jgi:hypothetical protein
LDLGTDVEHTGRPRESDTREHVARLAVALFQCSGRPFMVEIAFEQPSGTGPTRASQTAKGKRNSFFLGRIEDRFTHWDFDPFGRTITKA